MKKPSFQYFKIYQNNCLYDYISAYLKTQRILGILRNQMTFDRIGVTIADDNPIHFINTFLEQIELKLLGFEVQRPKVA